jgi:hypothetical protein
LSNLIHRELHAFATFHPLDRIVLDEGLHLLGESFALGTVRGVLSVPGMHFRPRKLRRTLSLLDPIQRILVGEAIRSAAGQESEFESFSRVHASSPNPVS